MACSFKKVLFSTAFYKTKINGNFRKITNWSDFDIQTKSILLEKKTKIPESYLGGRHLITLLPGAGAGVELMDQVKRLVFHFGMPIEFEEVNISDDSEDEPSLQYAIDSVKRNHIAIKGNIDIITKTRNVVIPRNQIFRSELNLDIFVVHFKPYPGLAVRFKDIDVVLFRRNIGDDYSMLEHQNAKGVVHSLKITTTDGFTKLANSAFKYAKFYGRTSVTVVHNLRNMPMSEGILVNACESVSKRFPNIELLKMDINRCMKELVNDPAKFDIILAGNLYGNVIISLIAGLSGGPGLYSGRNYGYQYAVFEPATRFLGESLKGKNVINPVANLNALGDLLNHLGYTKSANYLYEAIEKTITVDNVRTPDIGGKAKTSEVVDNIIQRLSTSEHWNWKHMFRDRQHSIKRRNFFFV